MQLTEEGRGAASAEKGGGGLSAGKREGKEVSECRKKRREGRIECRKGGGDRVQKKGKRGAASAGKREGEGGSELRYRREGGRQRVQKNEKEKGAESA